MVFLLDILVIVIPMIIVTLLFGSYYLIFVKGYVKRIKRAESNGDIEKAKKMKALAVKRQPGRMKRLFGKYGIQ
jgi:hypothetical protein